MTFLKEKAEDEMKDDEVEAVAGGKKSTAGDDAIFSVCTLGLGCLFAPMASEARGEISAKKCLAEISEEYVDTLFR